MYSIREFKGTRAQAAPAVALDPLAKIIWGEPHKRSVRLKWKVTDPGTHMGSEIPLITVSNKSSLP